MYIKFIVKVWNKLKEESNKTGKSIQQIVQEIIIEHYDLD